MSENCRHHARAYLAATACLIALLQMIGAFAAAGMGAHVTATNSWTLLMYMSADEPGSPLNWTQDINEMENGLNNQAITVIALVDPPGTGDSRVYDIVHDPQNSDIIVSPILPYPLLGSSGEAAMGGPSTLIDFADWAIDGYYQGGKIGIVFWGHGNSWNGVCQDQGDYLDAHELVQGLTAVRDHLGKKLDLVIFDACSMGSFEVLSTLSGMASFSVSSELLIPSYGFPYDAVLARISANVAMGAVDGAEAFADEYVRFGALMTDETSQAAVMNLAALGNATAEFQAFTNESKNFIPIAKALFDRARNSSTETDGTASVDLMTYLSSISGYEMTPRRIQNVSDELREMISNSTIFNRAYISSTDSNNLTPDSLRGISIFFPISAVPMTLYEDSTGVGLIWGGFLDLLHSNATFSIPNPALDIVMHDRKYNDGLMDSFSFLWKRTAEISEWECDVLVHNGSDVLAGLNFSDSSNDSGIIDSLVPGYYDVCIYGISADGSCRYYQIFRNVEIMRRYTFTVSLPVNIPEGAGEIEITNIRTGGVSEMNVSGERATISFVTPNPFSEGDRILLVLKRDNATIARGFIVLSGESTEVSMTGIPQPSGMATFVLFLLASVLLGFAFIRLVGRAPNNRQRERRRD